MQYDSQQLPTLPTQLDTTSGKFPSLNGDNSKPNTKKSSAATKAAQLKEAEGEYGPGVVISPRTGRPKRRKANRACVHCQRTHLTCDNDRPCERCVQRGLADTCRDGTRKKAKYLQDVPDSLANSKDEKKASKNRKKSESSPSISNGAAIPPPPATGGVRLFDQQAQLDPLQHSHRNSQSFQSSAVNLEYKVLSNILHGIDSNKPPNTVSPTISEESPSENGIEPQYHSHVLNHFTLNDTNQNLTDILSSVDGSAEKDWFQQQQPDSPGSRRPPISFAITDTNNSSFTEPPSLVADATASFADTTSEWRRMNEPADVYSHIRNPYSYTPGFHALIAYLRSRFDKEQLLKMAKCMAHYRPSFIACTNTLKEDDLIFMEQCFQRTLMEYEKFIAYSGTPTIVWRRTGQVTAVGKEFCILTGWSRERLLGQRTFIVELMDDHSVLEYFEMFSNIAFGDSRATMMSECTLLTPTGSKLKTSCMWTLKRDVFDIPMMIIGNFLPILS